MWNLIQRYVTHQCTEKERRRVEEWMKGSPSNRMLVEELQQIWESAPGEDFEVDARKALQRLKYKRSRLENLPQAQEKSSRLRTGSRRISPHEKQRHEIVPGDFSRLHQEQTVWRSFLRVAAVIAVAVALGWYVGTHLKNFGNPVDEHPVAMQKVITPKGEKAAVTFSDGSKIILNAASELRFPKEFTGKERKVYLDGEAYFEVAHNSGKPFVVQTGQTQIRDLGTKFDVRAWSEDKKVTVVVREGEVSVRTSRPAFGQQKVILKEGQYTVVKPGKSTLDVKKVDYRDYLLWLNGGLYFDNAPFSEVIKQIERRFDVNFDVADKDLLKVPFTGEFVKANLAKVLKVLSVSMNITCQKKDGTIIVRQKTSGNKQISTGSGTNP